MQLINQFLDPSLPFHTQDFKICVAYENPAAYAHARKLQNQLETACGGEIETTGIFWNFALFRHEELRKYAAEKITQADMIIISADQAAELPAGVRNWMEHWPRRPADGRAALVALFRQEGEMHPEQLATSRQLRQIAGQSGLDFFCNREHHDGALPAELYALSAGADLARMRDNISYHTPWENWGLND